MARDSSDRCRQKFPAANSVRYVWLTYTGAMRKVITALLIFSFSNLIMGQGASRARSSQTLPAGYWPLEKSQPIIDKTQTIRLAPDLSQLSAGERAAVAKLLEVGKIFQDLYEKQRHIHALSSYVELVQLDKRTGSKPATQNLLTLYRLFQGPIATTLKNKREPFLPVDPVVPGKNMYSSAWKKNSIEDFLAAHPETRDQIMSARAVVKETQSSNVAADLAKLRRYPVLDTLHPGLKQKIEAIAFLLRPTRSGDGGRPEWLYAVPYSIAYADQLTIAYALLNQAADDLQKDDEEFAKFLRNRARDLLSDDYESGDAAWVTGHFKNLNAQIGSYRNYDD